MIVKTVINWEKEILVSDPNLPSVWHDHLCDLD